MGSLRTDVLNNNMILFIHNKNIWGFHEDHLVLILNLPQIDSKLQFTIC